MLEPSNLELSWRATETGRPVGPGIADALVWVEDALWLIESLIGLVEVAPSFPCPACGGRSAEPFEIAPQLRGRLEAGLLLLLGSTDAAAVDWADILSVGLVDEAAELGGLTGDELRGDLAPVVEALNSAAASGITERANRSVAAGWVGDLIAPTPCICS